MLGNASPPLGAMSARPGGPRGYLHTWRLAMFVAESVTNCDTCHTVLPQTMLGCPAGRSRGAARPQRVPAVEGDRPVVS